VNGAVLLMCTTLVAIDGDSIKCDGVNMRDMGEGKPFVSGYDTPEIFRPQCLNELELGRAAKARMSELLARPGVKVFDSGKRDQYNRPLVSVVLANGKAVGSILIEEKLARVWTKSYKADWCSSEIEQYRGSPTSGRLPGIHYPAVWPRPKPLSTN
jgi:endonuclease YncB( thermonuclease family)